jgi:hypothetical protein
MGEIRTFRIDEANGAWTVTCVRVDEYLAVPGVSGLWAAGDCAAVPDLTTGNFCPPTAQHGLRQGIYLAKLPGLAKKLRVMVGWAMDLFFGREIEQMITLRDVELLSDRLARLRSKAPTRRDAGRGSGALASSGSENARP